MASFNPRRARMVIGGIAILLLAVLIGVFIVRNGWRRAHAPRAPQPIAANVQQTAQGFTFSKSEEGRTLFTIHASQMIQFRSGGQAELHDVNIIIYGRDSKRFDQIYGSGFEYDPQQQIIRAKGEVHIDLQADAEGVQHPDQQPPQELKNPVHLHTSGLVFYQKTGIAETSQAIDFRTPQASGSAVGATYDSHSSQLTLRSNVHIQTHGSSPAGAPAALDAASRRKPHPIPPAEIIAARAVIHSESRTGRLEDVTVKRGSETLHANSVTLTLREDSSVEKVVAAGDVRGEDSASKTSMHTAQAEFSLDEHSALQRGVLSGGAGFDSAGEHAAHATAGSVLLTFGPANSLARVRAEQNVHLLQEPGSKPNVETRHAAAQRSSPSRTGDGAGPVSTSGISSGSAQRVEVNAAALDLIMRNDGSIDRAVTDQAAQIVLSGTENTNVGPGVSPGQSVRSTEAKPTSTTTITAGRFEAAFDQRSRLKSVHAAPDAKTVTATAGQPDRVTSSRELDATFAPGGAGISTIVQQGDFRYSEGDRKATAERARFDAAAGLLSLSGSPRYSDAQSAVSASSLALNRRTGEMRAQGDVKTTYAEQKQNAGGAMLSSSEPIHVTAAEMTAQRAVSTGGAANTAGTARFTGGVRLWQGANIVQAPAIQFDREHRTMVAQGSATQKVETVFVQSARGSQENARGNPDNPNASTGASKSTPVTVTAPRLTYSDAERKARFEGGVTVAGAETTVTGDHADIFLLPAGAPRPQTAPNSGSGPAQIERMVAEGNIRIQQPERYATGQKLTYVAADDAFTLTGGPPSIFDAERGRLTGDALTFYAHSDRVLVDSLSDGNSKSRTIIHLRETK
jgi:lipopolysaccharide export system protein LptA